MKFALSYSGGKDCTLALYHMIQQDHAPVALIVTVNTVQQRSWFHGIQEDLLEAVSDSMEIPLILCPCEPMKYNEAFEIGLQKAREMGAEACVFGDIDEEGHRDWDEARCAAVGIESCLPSCYSPSNKDKTLAGSISAQKTAS